ncbi:AAA family ATPase [Salegentibacter sp. F14]
MIQKITLDSIASYKSSKVLETDKKANLIYGLNGTGKSTISNFLYNQNDQNYAKCSIEGLSDENEVLVYNQKFIQENFYESESQNGIFTLSKRNQEAEQKIQNARNQIKKAKGSFDQNEKLIESVSSERKDALDGAKKKIWEIKTEYTGGDRVFEFCLTGLKGNSAKLFEHIIQIAKPEAKPSKNIEELKKEILSITGDDAKKLTYVPKLNFIGSENETDELLSKIIVGSDNSSVGAFITDLGNSDWIKTGLNYLPDNVENKERCPFCQGKTITKDLIEKLKGYFDETYEKDISKLQKIHSEYINAVSSIPFLSQYEENPKLEVYKKEFDSKYKELEAVFSKNKTLLKDKIDSPSQSIKLNSTSSLIISINQIIDKVNEETKKHNEKIENIEKSLNDLKLQFWKIMRWEYDQTISAYTSANKKLSEKIEGYKKTEKELLDYLKTQNEIIVEQQKLTVNVEEAIKNINNGLLELGIQDFKIEKHSESFYKVKRKDDNDEVFKSLSEGEKMIISFLYFIEMCRGKKSIDQADKKKIIVVDDPISSLSHIYIFNIGRLIHEEFLRSEKYEQIFILTHSLYFFYELTDTNHTRRKENQNLYRLIKNQDGSQILDMKYEEIQNDYQSYWQVIKDEQQSPALIANCMRNIIEYFFNFVEKRDLGKFFQKPVMKETRFQSFNRYINRESHSLGQNIFDIKEFDYTDFKDAFRLVFVENNYEEHYKRMIR